MKALLKRACAIARRRPDLADATLANYVCDLNRRLDRLLATKPTVRKASTLRVAMELDRDKLFVFMRRRDVDPTNNASERDLRPTVTFRKVTGGFRSERGARSTPTSAPLSRPASGTAGAGGVFIKQQHSARARAPVIS